MHTARFCQQQKRSLFVLKPNENDNKNLNFEGNKKLIAEGAIAFNSQINVNDIRRKINELKILIRIFKKNYHFNSRNKISSAF